MPLAAAGIGAAGSLLGGITGGKGATRAAKIQADAAQAGLNEERRQFDQTQQNFAPFLTGGKAAEEQLRRLLGLGDSNTGIAVGNSPAYSAAEQQAGAIAGLQDSPLFKALDQSGTESILQNASATGGLRGGDTQSALYNNRSQLLAQIIQQQIANLGGLASAGAGAAGSLGTLGANNAGAISGLQGQQGAASASGILGAANATQNMFNNIGTTIGAGLVGLIGRNTPVINNPNVDLSGTKTKLTW